MITATVKMSAIVAIIVIVTITITVNLFRLASSFNW